MTVLARDEIIGARLRGDVLIEPYDERNVGNSSYDVTLGDHYYIEQPTHCEGFHNPYEEASVASMWGAVKKAEAYPTDLPGIPKGTPVIIIPPSTSILAHTHEFIGATDKETTTMMKARSSVGRSLVEITKCAGWGDIGYANRWTLEITNNSQYRAVILVPGRRIGQLVFIRTTGIFSRSHSYEFSGKYQHHPHRGLEFAVLIKMWKPEEMLPKMYKDREANGG